VADTCFGVHKRLAHDLSELRKGRRIVRGKRRKHGLCPMCSNREPKIRLISQSSRKVLQKNLEQKRNIGFVGRTTLVPYSPKNNCERWETMVCGDKG